MLFYQAGLVFVYIIYYPILFFFLLGNFAKLFNCT